MKIIISGGTGLIGQDLIKALRSDGHEIWVLTRSPEKARLPDGVQAARWDGKTAEGWGHLAERADAVINLAGENIGDLPWSNERKRRIRQSRKDAGAAIVAALQASSKRPSVVIQISGVNYYLSQGDKPRDESSPRGENYLASVAQDWEDSTKAVTELGVRHVIMRTGVALSPKGGVLSPFLFQHRLFAGGPLGSGKQWISWIHIQDLVNAIRFFLEHTEAEGVFNVTSPQPVTNADFGRTLGRVMKRPYWLPVPAFALKVVLGEMSTLVLDGQRVLPKRLEEMGFRFQYGDLQTALEDLIKRPA